MERITLLSDIHGNRWALEDVLTDASERRVTRPADLGDIFHGPLDPGDTAALRDSQSIPSTTILGNQDQILLDPRTDPAQNPSLPHTLRCLPKAAPRVAPRPARNHAGP